MTPDAATWGEVEAFLRADGWREIRGGERSGSRRRHVFYEKVLADGRMLMTHVSHSRDKSMSPGRFSSLLRRDLEVSREQFWQCVRTGRPVDRPGLPDEVETVQHDAWVVAVLVGKLHMDTAQLERLTRAEAEELVREHWSGSG